LGRCRDRQPLIDMVNGCNTRLAARRPAKQSKNF